MPQVDPVERIKTALVAEFGWSAPDPLYPQATPWPALDRGILRSRVEALIAELASQGGSRAAMAGEELAEILEEHPGDRIPLVVFSESPWSVMLAPYVAPLALNAFQAADAVFDLGVVRYRQGSTSGPLVSIPALCDLADQHSRAPGGILGLPATTENPESIASGVGPVRSRFILEPSYFSSGHNVLVDVLTVLDPSGSTTEVRIGVSVASGPQGFLGGPPRTFSPSAEADRPFVTGPPRPPVGLSAG